MWTNVLINSMIDNTIEDILNKEKASNLLQKKKKMVKQ